MPEESVVDPIAPPVDESPQPPVLQQASSIPSPAHFTAVENAQSPVLSSPLLVSSPDAAFPSPDSSPNLISPSPVVPVVVPEAGVSSDSFESDSSASLQDDSVLSAEARRLELMFTELPLLTLDHEF